MDGCMADQKSIKELIKPNITVLNDKYLILQEVGPIPNGTLYFGETTADQKVCYLKIYHDFVISGQEAFAALEDEMFAYVDCEHDSLQKPLEIFAAEIKDGQYMFPVLVMEKPVGQLLRKIMDSDEHKSLEYNRAMMIMKGVCEGVQALMEKGFLFSPSVENIILGPDDKVCLINIPFMRSLEQDNFDSQSNHKFYAAPELWEGEERDPRTEIYALGCLLYEMMEGDVPFKDGAQDEMHMTYSCGGLNNISKKANKVLLQAMSHERSKRFANPASFAEALGKVYKKPKAAGGGGGSSTIVILLIFILAGGGWLGWNELMAPSKRKPRKRKTVQRVKKPKKKPVVKQDLEKRLEKKREELKQKRAQNDTENTLQPVAKVDAPPLDGMAFIQAGIFPMGSVTSGSESSKKEHRISMSPFYIDLTEVTNAEYQKFVKAKGVKPPRHDRRRYSIWKNANFPRQVARQPVINVTWEQANKYCQWKDKRLPTEAEWEFAARGIEGRVYPWGNGEASPQIAHFDGEWKKNSTFYDVDFFKDGRTPEGVYNMLGSVKEWVADWYDENYYEKSPNKDPKGPEKGSLKVVRGGSWEQVAEPMWVRDGFDPKSRMRDTGFRCAKSYNK
jgi:formylglycine-generating enzyme required for sulfatase activity